MPDVPAVFFVIDDDPSMRGALEDLVGKQVRVACIGQPAGYAYRNGVDDLYQSRNACRPAWSELSLRVNGRYGRAMAMRDARGLVSFVICPSEIGWRIGR